MSRWWLLAWGLAIAVEWSRLPTMGGWVDLDFVARGLMWLALLTVTIRSAWRSGHHGVRVMVPLAGVLVVITLFNWVQLSPRWWFATHRPFYELARHHDPDHGLYGSSLPVPLRGLTANGSSSDSSARGTFFPQWFGLPDDAGGYFWSPEASPEGEDMAGLLCQRPVDLGGGWWMCGMQDR